MLDPDDETLIREAATAGATIVTSDRVLREACHGLTPVEALDKARAKALEINDSDAVARLDKLRACSPLELTALGKDADEATRIFQRNISLDMEHARLIRQLRIEEDYSWRAVARWTATVWGGPWEGNQIAGMVICQKAASLLGEDFMAPPWD